MTHGPLGRAFDRVLIIMFENQYRMYVMQNPYMRALARRGADLAGFSGVMHPSQTNYIASIAGELCGVAGDDPVRPLLRQRTIADLIEEAPGGLSWRAYMESYVAAAQPWTPELLPADAKPYYTKHNPFASFAAIVRDRARWARIDNEAALFADLLNGTLPDYAWFSPNVWSDGHWLDGTEEESDPRAPRLVDQAARWLEGFFARLRFPGPGSHLPRRTLVVVTFDEADFEAEWEPDAASTYDGPNQVYTVLLGDMIEPSVEREAYNHYSLLRTIEVNFGLGSLGKNDAGSSYLQFLWGRRFRWGAPEEAPIGPAGALAAAGSGGALHVVYSGPEGALRARSLSEGAWSGEAPIEGAADALALAATGGRLLLVAREPGGRLWYRLSTPDLRWDGAPEPLAEGPVEAFALCAVSASDSVMLAWLRADGTLRSRLWSEGRWADESPIAGAAGGRALALGALGASLYLVLEAEGTGRLEALSYNTAPFNVVTPGAPNDTTVDAWSPCSFPLAHYAARPSPRTPGEPEPDEQTYAARGPLAIATLDGVLHLVYPGGSSPTLQDATLSLAGLLTPSAPIGDAADRSDGYGTLAEAGWNEPKPVPGTSWGPGSALAMAEVGDALALLFQPEAGGPVRLARGRYERRDTPGATSD